MLELARQPPRVEGLRYAGQAKWLMAGYADDEWNAALRRCELTWDDREHAIDREFLGDGPLAAFDEPPDEEYDQLHLPWEDDPLRFDDEDDWCGGGGEGDLDEPRVFPSPLRSSALGHGVEGGGGARGRVRAPSVVAFGARRGC